MHKANSRDFDLANVFAVGYFAVSILKPRYSFGYFQGLALHSLIWVILENE